MHISGVDWANHYTFGRRLCCNVVSEFGDAKLGCEDYTKDGGKRPNCSKFATLNAVEGSKPGQIVDLNLSDAQDPDENDQQAANIGLPRFRQMSR
jgi:hypothetical protein